MKFENTESDVKSDENESYIEEKPQPMKHTKKSNKIKRKYEDIPTDAPASKKKHKNDLYKPPTVEELNNLTQTENLYNNSLFKLQIEALLKEVMIKTKRKNKLTNWLDILNRNFDTIPSITCSLSELHKVKAGKIKGKNLLKNFVLLGEIFKADQDVILKFEKPKNVQCFGLFANNSLPGPNLTLKLNLTISKNSFLVKDYLNNRYLIKRCFYLLYIAEFLKCDLMVDDLKIIFHENNHLLPIISLQPKDCDNTNILIYVSPSDDTFKPSRFLPDQNNIKLNLFGSNVDINILKKCPTVLYNSLVAHDVTLYTNNEFIKEALQDRTDVQDSIKMLCVWLKQRELSSGLGAFTETLLLNLVVYLLHKKKINKFMSSYQIVRNFWNFLSVTDLLIESISMGESSLEVLAKFKQYFRIVFLDKTDSYNLASFLSEEVYKKVQLESQAALKYLDKNINNCFQELFVKKHPFNLQYDVIIDLTKSMPLENKFDLSEEEKSVYIGYDNILIFDSISKMLKTALNKRALNMVPRIEMNGKKLERLLFGINLDPKEAFHILEKGPPLNNFTEATAFRDFWGPHSSDRRFRDGSTNVAVHYRVNTIRGKRNIIKKIIQFVMEYKLKINYKVHYNEYEDVLLWRRLVPNYPSGTNEETCLKIVLASDELSKKLRDLQISLKITGVQGVSDVYAYAQVFPPIPSNVEEDSDVTTAINNNLLLKTEEKVDKIPRYIQPIECVLQLEHSSKWPNDLQEFRLIKASFYVEISTLLKKTHDLLTHPTRDYLDVFYEGIVFRYRLFVPKEIGLVKRVDSVDGSTSFKDSLESFDMEVSLCTLPKIMGALKGIQSLYPSYGPGTALVKRWLRTHMVDEYLISDVVIDLLNASIYLNCTSCTPNTPQASFLRCVKFISELDWDLQLVVVNFNDDLSGEEISKIESRVQENRTGFPELIILTPYDQTLSVFTENAPTKEVLCRIKQLAKDSLAFHDRTVADPNGIGVKELFIPNFDGYDLLIHLKSSLNAKRHERITFGDVSNRVVVEKYTFSKGDKMPIVDFDPVEEYLGILRRNYGKYAVFFHDGYGGSVIGVLWQPKVSGRSDFKVATINGGKVVDNDQIVFNFDAAIEDFFVLGGDLVKTIEKR